MNYTFWILERVYNNFGKIFSWKKNARTFSLELPRFMERHQGKNAFFYIWIKQKNFQLKLKSSFFCENQSENLKINWKINSVAYKADSRKNFQI